MLASKDIAEKTGNSIFTVLKWASVNGVPSMGEGRRKVYIWSEDDLNRFENRNKVRGRPKTKDSE